MKHWEKRKMEWNRLYKTNKKSLCEQSKPRHQRGKGFVIIRNRRLCFYEASNGDFQLSSANESVWGTQRWLRHRNKTAASEPWEVEKGTKISGRYLGFVWTGKPASIKVIIALGSIKSGLVNEYSMNQVPVLSLSVVN